MSAHQVLAQLANADWNIADPGASGTITVLRSGTCEIISAGSEARTLAAPTQSDLEIAIVGKTIPSGTVTVTIGSSGSYTESSDTAFTITAAGQFMLLRSFEIAASTFAWRRIASDTAEAVVMPAATITTLAATTVNATTVNATTVAAGTTLSISAETYAATTGMVIGDPAAVTQLTNFGTAVAIVAGSGTITTLGATAAAAGEESFSVTNAALLGTEIVLISAKYNGTTGTPLVWVSDQAAGSFTISVTNLHASEVLNGTNSFNINYLIINQGS